MKIDHKLIINIIVLFLFATIMVLQFHYGDGTILQKSLGQICCKNIQSNVKGNSSLSDKMQLTSAKGYVVSLQENKGGNFTWIAFGRWNASRANPNQTNFDAKFNMIKDDSSETHKYRISNFTQTNSSSNPVSVVLNGTATLRLDSTELHQVPISLRIMDTGGEMQTIMIRINPLAVQNHFGETPIYGTVTKLVK